MPILFSVSSWFDCYLQFLNLISALILPQPGTQTYCLDGIFTTIRIEIEISDCPSARFELRNAFGFRLDDFSGSGNFFALQRFTGTGIFQVFGPDTQPNLYVFRLVFPCARRLNDHPVGLLQGPDLHEKPSFDSGLSPFEFLKEGILNSAFDGASGGVQFNSIAGRSATGISVGLYNVRPQTNTEKNESHTYNVALVSIYTDEISGWVDVAGNVIYFPGGRSEPLGTGLVVYDEHYLKTGVRSVGLILMLVIWFGAISLMVLIFIFRESAAIQAGDPWILFMLCFGSIVMSSTIFAFSWDEGAGWTATGLTNACTSAPWLFFMGQFITFSTFAAMMWRLEMEHKYEYIVESDSFFGSLLFASICGIFVLIVALLISWTIVDPWSWERVVVVPVPLERFGQCTGRYFVHFYLPLGSLVMLFDFWIGFQAWNLMYIRTMGPILYAVYGQLQVWCFGTPILAVLGSSSSDGLYFARVLLVWSFSISSLSVVVIPKVSAAIQVWRNPALVNSAKQRVSMHSAVARESMHLREHSTSFYLQSPTRRSRIMSSTNILSPTKKRNKLPTLNLHKAFALPHDSSSGFDLNNGSFNSSRGNFSFPSPRRMIRNALSSNNLHMSISSLPLAPIMSAAESGADYPSSSQASSSNSALQSSVSDSVASSPNSSPPTPSSDSEELLGMRTHSLPLAPIIDSESEGSFSLSLSSQPGHHVATPTGSARDMSRTSLLEVSCSENSSSRGESDGSDSCASASGNSQASMDASQ